MSKGSQRRPGAIPPGAWDAIFKKPANLCDCEQGKCKAPSADYCKDWTKRGNDGKR